MNFFKNSKKKEIIALFFLYLVFFIIGVNSFKDYGISVDEWELRLMGFSNLKYILEILSYENIYELDKIAEIPELTEYLGTHGAIFALPMSFLEFFFGIIDSKNHYLLRHYTNHFIFLISSFYFYLLIKQRFNNFYYGILGAIFLYLSPRIFAESFYNHKDIIFLSLFIINLYYAIIFFKKPTAKNSCLFALTTALSIDIRIMGILIVPIVIFAIYLEHSKKFKIIFPSILLFFILFPIITIIFWPYLWENPVTNFLNVFSVLSSYPHEGYNFYLGKYHLVSKTPWHYVMVWILITTPTFYLFLFFYGLFNYIKEIYKNIDKEKLLPTNNNIEDFIYLSLFVLPIFIVIFLNSTIYNGWRHLYFVYPCLLIFSMYGLDKIKIKFFKNKEKLYNIIVFLFIFQISYTMINNHPYQNVYFNFIAGKNVKKNFEIDYWGLSNKQALELILKNDQRNLIKVGSAGPISLNNSMQILSKSNRDRLIASRNIDADYIINNYIDWHGKYKKKRYLIPDNFSIYDEISAYKIIINTIYKKN